MAEFEEDMDEQRIRTLTEKGLTNYFTSRDKYFREIDEVCVHLKETLNQLNLIDKSDFVGVQQLEEKLRELRKTYAYHSYEFLGFLKKTHTEDSLTLHAEYKGTMSKMNEAVDNALQYTVPTQTPDQLPTKTHSSNYASTTGSSKSSSRLTTVSQKRAKAEAARARLEVAKKEAELRKKKANVDKMRAEFDADLTLLAEQKEAAAAEAEAVYLESEVINTCPALPVLDSQERTRQYVSRLHVHTDNAVMNNNNVLQPNALGVLNDATAQPAVFSQQTRQKELSPLARTFIPNHELMSNAQPAAVANAETFTSYLLKKDMLLQRLYPFNDEPQSFDVWRASFRSVIDELKLNSFEELGLLVKNLGKESASFARSLRSSNARDPARAVHLIWERLQERYGRAELIEFSLKSKLEKFPLLTNKDNKKLYELCDLLDEILSAKNDQRFAVQFALFDSSRGVNSIVAKLPYFIQQKWITCASKYKQQKQVSYPPFSVFVDFVHDMCRVRNDPAFQLDFSNSAPQKSTTHRRNEKVFVAKTDVRDNDSRTRTRESSDRDSNSTQRCPIHNAKHSLSQCREFKLKTWSQRRALLRDKGLCYRCFSTDHISAKCNVQVTCETCGRKNHSTVMHREESAQPHGGESGGISEEQESTFSKAEPEIKVSSKSTSVNSHGFKGRSCGKIILVDLFLSNQPSRKVRAYALLDDQSNRSLVTPELCNMLDISGKEVEYTLTSCAGRTTMVGKRINGLSVQSVRSSETIDMSELIECGYIPQDLNEVPTPDVADEYSHLQPMAQHLHPLDSRLGIHVLIGRDVPKAHHVIRQIIGPENEPFAQELPLGWVIIGQVCLGKFHQPDTISVYKTSIDSEGRCTVMDLCDNVRTVTLCRDDGIGNEIFRKSPDDDKIGLSADDRQFIQIMDSELVKDNLSGQWMAPLPFKEPREPLMNNRTQAYQRAKILDKSLRLNSVKRQHMVEFMNKVFKSGAAEVAVETDDEKWYLPLFGVYHPRKPGQIRGVFDSSVMFEGKSLNNILLSGPNLTNSLIGVLLRFRSNEFAVSADIEQMFYRFLVTPDHRRFLRFFWYQDNNPDLPLMEYQMRVHVFGNKPSPAVATYALRKMVEYSDDDVKQHVQRNFYVDDALLSLPTREEAVSLLSRIRKVLEEGSVNLHKIASNDIQIMNHFPKETLSKDLKNLDLDVDSLPQQSSLGLVWDLLTDMFKFSAPDIQRPFTRRGLLSAMNSIYDPLGFLAPFSVSGKMLLREVCPDGSDWDEAIPTQYLDQWNAWNEALCQLDGYQVPRMFVRQSLSLLENYQVCIYTDASEKGIAAVAYIIANTQNGKEIGFIMGKAKVAPKSGHSIPRLELCGAVLGIDLAQCVSEHLDIPLSAFSYYVDSKVVLGYIFNRTRRFYTYVSNRVARIQDFSKPEQWQYVQSELNPADSATRSSLQDVKSALNRWHSGPTHIFRENTDREKESFDLCEPDSDLEIRPEVVVKATSVETVETFAFERFSSWKRLVATYAILIHVARTFKRTGNCNVTSWHVCKESTASETLKAAERLIISEVQKQFYSDEIFALGNGKTVHKDSLISSLSPYLDENGLLRVGGRLNQLRNRVGIESVNPIIIPRSRIATLLVLHFHERVFHQGRHFTEGSLRSNGFWVVGAKKLVSTVIHQCVVCRKLRGPFMYQKMADVPEQRLTPGPPFTAVGVDVFGPWEVVTRKTRGGVANSKRWAVMFTCMTSRATHIEVIEDMSSSCFINALTRLIAIRGPVKTLYSDRGTNFIGAASLVKAHIIHVEDQNFQKELKDRDIVWIFNSPHSSHMGGVWERPIGIARRILEGMLVKNAYKELTHEVLSTFMYEVAAVMNSRPLVAIDSDSSDPLVLSPNILLTQKQGVTPNLATDLSLRDMHTAQWKKVQFLSDIFWKQWKSQYLQSLQSRRKWSTEQRDLCVDDLVLLKNQDLPRYSWPVALVTKLFPSTDGKVRKCEVRVGNRDGEQSVFTRPITDLVLLCEEQ